MSKEAILGVVRHILTFGGGLLVSKGAVDEATMLEGVGAIITLAGIVWSIRQKKKLA
jgi:hypothetical protein